MAKGKPKPTGETHRRREKEQSPSKKTSTFLLELPLLVEEGDAARLRGHLEAGRQFYNAVLSLGQQRLRHMRADPGWNAARSLPRSDKAGRAKSFARLRARFGFSESSLQEAGKQLRTTWIAEHLSAVL